MNSALAFVLRGETDGKSKAKRRDRML
jgi:hypothetical protein